MRIIAIYLFIKVSIIGAAATFKRFLQVGDSLKIGVGILVEFLNVSLYRRQNFVLLLMQDDASENCKNQTDDHQSGKLDNKCLNYFITTT